MTVVTKATHLCPYCMTGAGGDLRVSNVVDVPNYVVSALLPEGIFEG